MLLEPIDLALREVIKSEDNRVKIEGLGASCCRFDIHLTRVCVVSVRFWCPDISPIYFLKDRQHGDFNTSENRKPTAAEFPAVSIRRTTIEYGRCVRGAVES
jgi:hypothetical protein